MLEVHNGHMYAAKLADSGLKVDLKSIPIPWDGMNSNIDLDRTVSLIREHRPRAGEHRIGPGSSFRSPSGS